MAEGTSSTSWWQRLVSVAKTLFWLVLVVVVLQQVYGSNKVENARASVLDRFQQERKSRVIALIHRQETVTLFGVPVSSSISIEDSEAVLRAIRLTPPEQPIDVILHTPGGLVLAAEQIAKALVQRKAKVTAFVPHYAMSGGSLIALAADEIVMDPNAVLGPVDPQIGDMPAASIIKLLSLKKPEDISDEMLILADMSAKARVQVGVFVMEVLLKHLLQGEGGGARHHAHRGAVDPRLPDHGGDGARARPAHRHRDAAHGVRPDGPLSAGRSRPPVRAVRSAPPRHAGAGRVDHAVPRAAGQGPDVAMTRAEET